MPPPPLDVQWLGRIDYRSAWELQHELVRARGADEIPDQLLLLEHDAVLTLGRNADPAFIRASSDELAARGVDVISVERGGEVTYHGPGQLVAYPIVKVADRRLLIRPYVRALEAAMSRAAATYGVAADRRDGHPGCWCGPEGEQPRKLGALGIRIERGVAYHGIALNVTTRLEDFELIDPCGMPGLDVTSIAREAEWPSQEPSTASVEECGGRFAAALGETLAEGATAAAARGSEPDETTSADRPIPALVGG
jgi:lipoyl(octanoyl) transferase